MSGYLKTTEELIMEAVLKTPAITETVNQDEIAEFQNASVGEMSLSKNPYLRVLSVLITGVTEGKSERVIYQQICDSLRLLEV